MKCIIATLASVALVALLAAAAVVGLGLYDISATDNHLAPTYHLIDLAMRRSVARRADALAVPPLDREALQARGATLFDEHCLPCHGAPGIAPAPFALGLTPAPANLVHTARAWPPARVYWVVRHGIKMTAMPAWGHRLDDADLWAVVAFVATLPALSPADYAARTGRAPPAPVRPAPPDLPPPARRGDAARGEEAIGQYACVTCHAIPGVVGPNAPVGPPLDGFARRKLIAGTLPNTPANLAAWLQAPQRFRPGSAMPDLGVSAQHAADIAAYLHERR